MLINLIKINDPLVNIGLKFGNISLIYLLKHFYLLKLRASDF